MFVLPGHEPKLSSINNIINKHIFNIFLKSSCNTTNTNNNTTSTTNNISFNTKFNILIGTNHETVSKIPNVASNITNLVLEITQNNENASQIQNLASKITNMAPEMVNISNKCVEKMINKMITAIPHKLNDSAPNHNILIYTYIHISLSLSLSLYIYIYIYNFFVWWSLTMFDGFRCLFYEYRWCLIDFDDSSTVADNILRISSIVWRILTSFWLDFDDIWQISMFFWLIPTICWWILVTFWRISQIVNIFCRFALRMH